MAALNGQRTLDQILAEQSGWLFNNQSTIGTHSALSTACFPTTQMMIDMTNKWYKRFASSHPWEWKTQEGTIATVQGTQRITMPDNAAKPEVFTIRNLSKLIPVYTRQQFLSMYPSGWTNVGQGIPMIAVEAIFSANNSRQYDLWPIPGAVYTINYESFAYVNPLDGTTYIYGIMPPDYDDILVHGPLSEAFMILNQPERAEYHQTEAEKIRQRAFMDNEMMISTMNQVRGYDADSSQALIFPYHPYGGG